MFDIEFNPKESFLKQELAVSGITNNIAPAVIGAVGSVVGTGLSLLGDDGSADRERRAQKRAAKKSAKESYRASLANWKFDWKEETGQAWRKYEYAQETVDIAKQNQDTQIALQQEQLDQRYAYDMSIRQYNYDQQMRLRNQQVAQAQQQVGFNEDAFNLGMYEQKVFREEQELAIEFEQIGLNVQLEGAEYSAGLSERMNDTKQRQTRAKNQFQMQISAVEGLEAEGKGSAGKSVQASFAKNGAQQAYIAEMTTQANEQYALTAQQNVNTLDEAYKKIFMGNNQLDASRASLKRADIFARANLTLEMRQANADAMNKIMLMPELAPEIPKPPNLADYAAVLQDPFEPEAPPKPRETVPAYIPSPSTGGFLNAAPLIGQGISAAAGLYASFNKPKVPTN
jgi:hypothetical protein